MVPPPSPGQLGEPGPERLADPIDRLAPARRPSGPPLMYQGWRSLLFLHWELPPEEIRALLPPGLELDLFDGRAFVGLVPFTMTGVRPAGLPACRPLSDFHETNVRTYVHRLGSDPGVWFFSLDAANRVAVALARHLFHLSYYHARMSLDRDTGGGPTEAGAVSYRSERRTTSPSPANCAIRCLPEGSPTRAVPGTLDHFLIERYILYAQGRTGLYRGCVHHVSYPIRHVHVLEVEETLVAAAGLRRPDASPLAHFSDGVDVEVFGLESV